MSIHVTVFKKKTQNKNQPSCFYKPSHQATEKSFLDRSTDLSHPAQCPPIHSWDPKESEGKTHKTIFHEWCIMENNLFHVLHVNLPIFFKVLRYIYIYSKDKATDVRQPQRRPPLWHGGQTVSRGHRTHSSPSTAAKLKHLNIQTPSPASETPVSGNCSMLQVNYYNGSLPPYFKE